MRVGRNDPCPCGSGKKYKRCFLLNRCAGSVSAEFENPAREAAEAEQRRRQQYGAVRPIIHARDKDRTLIAVGSRIFFDAPDRNVRWNTFTDLLFGYIRTAIGSGWGQAELRKPLAERHQVMQWYDHVCRLQRETAVLEPNGLYAIDADGVTTAYLHLAYDLFILDDHRLLQKEVLRRLRRRENFAGARYELLVAATMVRAGCSIAFVEEHGATLPHPEFVATHKATGFAFSVEAKARQRTVRVPKAGERLKAGVRDLLTDAATKETVRPYVAFVEVDLPPDDSKAPAPWFEEVRQTTRDVVAELGHCPFDLVVFTNYPHVYGEFGAPDPARHVYSWKPDAAFRPTRLPAPVENAIAIAVTQYDNIPKELPGHDSRRGVR